MSDAITAAPMSIVNRLVSILRDRAARSREAALAEAKRTDEAMAPFRHMSEDDYDRYLDDQRRAESERQDQLRRDREARMDTYLAERHAGNGEDRNEISIGKNQDDHT